MRIILALVFALGVSPAMAVQCGPHDAILKWLSDKYHEVPIGVGMMADEATGAELTVAPDGSWTLVMTDKIGQACLLTGGINWNAQPPPKPGAPA
jgi:hypothetical protein